MYCYSDKLGYYKIYDFRKFIIPDAFEHVRLQNTINRCKVHQILPLMVDYACFLVKCINYQKVMCLQMIYFLQDLARFLQKTSDFFIFRAKNVCYADQTFPCKIFQETCKIFLYFQDKSGLA